MFMLVQVHRSRSTGKVTGQSFVDDCLVNIEEARQCAYDNGPGEYWILSRSRAPGHRCVERVRVGAQFEARETQYA